MDAKEQARLRLAAQHLVALAEGAMRWEWRLFSGEEWDTSNRLPLDTELIKHPDCWRVAELEPNCVCDEGHGIKCAFHAYPNNLHAPESEKCAMCGATSNAHPHDGKNWCVACDDFIPTSLAGPRPEPPEGCGLLAPAVPKYGECGYYWVASGWIAIHHGKILLDKFWRARRIAKPELVSDHDMLVAHIRWHRAAHEPADDQKHDTACIAFLAQEGGKNV